MKKLIAMATVYLSLLALVVNTAFAQQTLPFPSEKFGLETGEGQVPPGSIQALCYVGFYIDDAGNAAGTWDTTLFVANLGDTPLLFDVTIYISGAANETSHQVGPRELLQLTCDQLRACDSQGWVYAESNSGAVDSILFVTNNTLGGGAFTTIPLQCFTPS